MTPRSSPGIVLGFAFAVWACADPEPSAVMAPGVTAATSGAAGSALPPPSLQPPKGAPQPDDATTEDVAADDPDAASPPSPPVPPPAPVDAMRDPRPSRSSQRAFAVIVGGIQALESIAPASRTGADIQTLAEDFVELEREASAAIRSATPSPSTARSAALLRARNGTRRSASASAIRWYREAQTVHPSYGRLDEVDYYLGYEYERQGESSNARTEYLDLMIRMPASQFASRAAFALGEMLLQESAVDAAKLDEARSAYEKAAHWTAGPNPAYGWACVRIGQVLERRGDASGAAAAFAKARAFALTHWQASEAAGILDALP